MSIFLKFPEQCRVHNIITFGRGKTLVVMDLRATAAGFRGLFLLSEQQDVIIATGQCPGEVYMELARVPALAEVARDILNIPVTRMDMAA